LQVRILLGSPSLFATLDISMGWRFMWLADLEVGKREPHPATLFVLENELAAAGIMFTQSGVEFREWPAKPYVPTGIRQKMPRPEPPPEKAGSTRKTIKNLTLARQRR
jgi:hypothetical protein